MRRIDCKILNFLKKKFYSITKYFYDFKSIKITCIRLLLVLSTHANDNHRNSSPELKTVLHFNSKRKLVCEFLKGKWNLLDLYLHKPFNGHFCVVIFIFFVCALKIKRKLLNDAVLFSTYIVRRLRYITSCRWYISQINLQIRHFAFGSISAWKAINALWKCK